MSDLFELDIGVLKSILQDGILKYDTNLALENMKKQEILEQHNQKITKCAGRWQTYVIDEDGRKLLRKTNRKDLEDEIVKFYRQAEDNPTIKQCFEQWVNDKIRYKEIAYGTYDKYCNDFKRYFNGTDLIKKRIRSVTEDELEEFIRVSIADKELSSKAYANLRTIIIGIFKYAKKRKVTEISISTFFRDLDISKRAFTRKQKIDEEQVFSEYEVKLLYDYLMNNADVRNLALILAFQTGLRTAELATLKYSDIDMINGTIHIQRQEIKYKDRENNGKLIHEVVEYTKSEAGNRKVIMPTIAYQTIKMIKKLNPFGEYLLEVRGKRILTNSFNDRLYKACREVGIKPRSMHKIRKTYGTTLIDAGTDESLVMLQMGHSDITTTKKYYYYSNKGLQAKKDQIERAFG